MNVSRSLASERRSIGRSLASERRSSVCLFAAAHLAPASRLASYVHAACMHSAARFASSGTIVVPRLANPNAQPHPPVRVYVWACMCVASTHGLPTRHAEPVPAPGACGFYARREWPNRPPKLKRDAIDEARSAPSAAPRPPPGHTPSPEAAHPCPPTAPPLRDPQVRLGSRARARRAVRCRLRHPRTAVWSKLPCYAADTHSPDAAEA